MPLYSVKTIRITIQMRKGQFNDKDFEGKSEEEKKKIESQNTVVIEGLPTQVGITKQGGDDPNTAHVIIKNMSIENVKKLTTLAFKQLEVNNNYIQIDVGNKGDQTLATAFAGEITKAVPQIDSSATLSLSIDASAGYYASLIAAPPLSVNGTVSIESLLAQWAEEAKYKYENKGVQGTVENAVFLGSPIKKCQTLAHQYDFDLLIDDGKITSQPWNAPADGEIPLIANYSGLLGYPSFSDSGISFTCIFNDKIKVGGIVSLQSILPWATAEWQVTKVEHQLSAFDNSGRWETNVDAVVPGTEPKNKKKKTGTAATGSGSLNVDDGLAQGFAAWNGVTMDNGTEGCAEAVGKIGSYYSPFLAQECRNGVVYVPTMITDAGDKFIPFSETNLAKGDVIVYGGDEHVVIYDGAGGYVGNSSSQNMVVHGGNFYSMGGLQPTGIIKTSEF